MKKEVKVVAIVLAAILVFMLGVGLGTTQKGISIDVNVNGGAAQPAGAQVPDTQPTAAPVDQPTAAPVNDAPTAAPADQPTAAPANDAPTAAPANDKPTEAPASSAKVPQGTEAIVAKYNEVVNAAKACSDVTIHKTSNTDIRVTEAPMLKDKITDIVKGLVKPSDDTYEIKGGTTEDGTTASAVITPGNRDIHLEAAGVKTATATPEGDGYKLSIVLKEEKSTFDGTNTVNPDYHASCLSPLNLATLDIPAVKITSADMTYPGATLNCTVDGQGRLTHYDFKLPMSGGGTGKLGLSITVGLEGEMVETFDLTY